MNYIFVIPTITSLLFCLVKFLERKYLTDSDEFDKLSLKFIVRDAITIFSLSLFANFIYVNAYSHINDFFSIITDTNVSNINATAEIFTDNPNF
jgi:hypothetical protein